MATTLTTTAIFAALFLTSLAGVTPQSPSSAPSPSIDTVSPLAPSPGPDCFTALLNLSDCLTYVEAGSNLTAPDKACCPELAGLVDSQPICLCQLLGNTDSFGVQIDKSKAIDLPTVCGVSTPPVSLCSAVGFPIGGPSSAPSEGPGVLAPEGVAANPASGNSSNGASSIGISPKSIFVGLVIAFFTSFF